jgi:signal transduction histidine kinase
VRIAIDRLPREIRPLVSAVNAALDRMARAYEAERRFVADAAHELRTPLTVLSLRLQQAHLSGAPNWGQIDQDVAQMTRVVSQLLDLARKEFAEADDPARLDVVDVGRAAREAAALILPLADAARRSVELDLPERLPVRGRSGDLQDMLRNLLENAVIHGQGTIRVAGLLSRSNDKSPQVAITVSDQGTKLGLTDRDRLFDRFRKADATSNRSGLGLAIVREVVRAHGGTAQFAPGPHTVVQVLLPAYEVQPVYSKPYAG